MNWFYSFISSWCKSTSFFFRTFKNIYYPFFILKSLRVWHTDWVRPNSVLTRGVTPKLVFMWPVKNSLSECGEVVSVYLRCKIHFFSKISHADYLLIWWLLPISYLPVCSYCFWFTITEVWLGWITVHILVC